MIVSLNIPDDLIAFIGQKATDAKLSRSAWMTALLRRVQSQATAPVEWYVQHIAGCLVGFAARLNLPALPDALGAFQHCAGVHMPPAAFTARVQAELIRLGMGGATPVDGPPPA